MHDELMNEIDSDEITYEAFFQFDDEEPIGFAMIQHGKDLTIRLSAETINVPELTFDNGRGKKFKIFLSPSK